MVNLYLINELTNNGSYYIVLNFISLITILCGVLVIISKNPIVSVLFLIGLFLSIATYLMILGLNFLGLSYLLVYVGAVSILFLFILMLINVRVSELITENNNSVPLGIMTCISFYTTIDGVMISSKSHSDQEENYLDSWLNYITRIYNYVTDYNMDNTLYYVTSNTWDGNLAEASHITAIGNVIYTVYPMWIIITSLILLLAMVGAIVITMKDNPEDDVPELDDEDEVKQHKLNKISNSDKS